MNSSAPAKSTIERLLDAGVYAPLGYVLRRDEVRQDLAKAGRKQVAFARSLGRAALKGVGRGLRPTPEPAPAAKPTSAPPSSPTPTPEPAVSPVEIAGYDEMSARDIIALVRDGSADQAQWVLAHETDGKQRVTVLRAANKVLGHDD